MCLLFAFLLQRELFLPVCVWDYIIKKDHSEKKNLNYCSWNYAKLY